MSKTRAHHQLETRIESFLSRKFKQFPELTESPDDMLMDVPKQQR